MTDERKIEKPAKIETLELNKETVQDLTESEAKKAEGGMRPVGGPTCANQASGCASC